MLEKFLSFHEEPIGPPASIYELFDAMQQMELENFIAVRALDDEDSSRIYTSTSFSREDSPGRITTDSLTARITDRGLICLDHHGGDPYRMKESQRHTISHKTYNLHGPTGNLVIGDGSIRQGIGFVAQNDNDAVDVGAIRRFAEAVEQAIPALNLSMEAQHQVDELLFEIAQAAAVKRPDHNRLRVLGNSLRTLLEGTAGGVLSGVLLGLWGS
ncbi:hypothetical protein AGRA3207_003845 [Actinomadura graeca]|uniref:GAF domain-containing protein n=1 Tax=Actinomadura graeca TaxID=2750812 RepID=A0ABX8QVL6_9ACTN|nr:hypothetical protein [Actinomadura graeca]QXJ22785.1 hypothetical protein AGRA3207_003845 [Actinomadura graeca]